MIRVKTVYARYLGIKILFFLLIMLIIIPIFRLILNMTKAETRVFASELVNKNLSNETYYSKSELNLHILKNELCYREEIARENQDLAIENTLYIDGKNEGIEIAEVPNKVVNLPVKIWDRPSEFPVQVSSTGKVTIGTVGISNYSGLKLDTAELSKVSQFPISSNTNILLVHTHTSEGYRESGKEANFRTLDDSKNVVSVGKALKDSLLLNNFKVKHCVTKHDTPSYNGAYSACLKTLEEEFAKENYDIVLDIHRDALSGNLNYRPTAEINGESAAKLMFVVGTNGSGLKHDNWMENLKLALLIQNKANEMYPGLFRDLNLSKYRYNEDICEGALILEVGATGNSLEEVWNSMKYFSNVLNALRNG